MSTHTIEGRLTQIPKIVYTDKGVCVTNFSLAENIYVGKDEKGNAKFEPIYHRCVAFGDIAERIGNDSKVGRIYKIIAKSIPDNYVNKEGKKVYSSKFQALAVEFGPIPKKYAEKKDNAEGKNKAAKAKAA